MNAASRRATSKGQSPAQNALAGIPHTIERPDRLPALMLAQDARHDVLLAFKEALHNAARHGGGARVTVRFVAKGGHIGFDVHDDGPGFDVAAPPVQAPGAVGGRGLRTLRRRAERAGADLRVASAAGKGTCVSFRIPTPEFTG